jgi:hypothetical protein
MTIQEIHYTRPVETEEYEIFDLQQQIKKDMCRKNRKKTAIQDQQTSLNCGLFYTNYLFNVISDDGRILSTIIEKRLRLLDEAIKVNKHRTTVAFFLC